MIESNFREVFKIIYEKLKENEINWAVIGSTNMKLQGMKVKPRDLDIIIHLKDLVKMKDIFSEYEVSPITKLKPIVNSAWEIILNIKDVEVQFLGEKEGGVYDRKLIEENLVYINIDRLKIPCFKLEIDARAYEQTGRIEKAKLIRNFLGSKLS